MISFLLKGSRLMKSTVSYIKKAIIITRRERYNLSLLLVTRISVCVVNTVRMRKGRSSTETRSDAHPHEEICQDRHDFLNRNHQNKTNSI